MYVEKQGLKPENELGGVSLGWRSQYLYKYRIALCPKQNWKDKERNLIDFHPDKLLDSVILSLTKF